MQKPFQELGGELKSIRQKLQESVAEVSGAVEIDMDALERIETGQERPSEDVLMLLISHFGVRDDRAVELWQLAGYDQLMSEKENSNDLQNRTVMVMMALDTRILYSDGTHINANKAGVVLNFLQNSDTPNQQVPIARVGMSYEQAQAFLNSLSQTLTRAASARQPKRLTMPKSPKNNKSKAD
ncbi:MAG TPA: helix-turn-helix transcriptional regulator [Candidatus Saccharimonadales bacterium]|nr:helix-turn-helix transcriptional regulator [Candidatus Saccharimonadales bacterium]